MSNLNPHNTSQPAFAPYLPLPCVRSRSVQHAHATPRRPNTFTSSPSLSATPGRPSRPYSSTTTTTTTTAATTTPLHVSRKPLHVSPVRNSGNKKPPRSNRSPDFHANVGTVIDTLRSDYATLLTEAPDLSMFRDDILLSDASGNTLAGKDAYKTVLFLLRAHARLFLLQASLHIVSMHYSDETKPSPTTCSTSGSPCVHVRWRMRATPRAWYAAHRQPTSVVDGISVYYLDSCGHVAKHTFETKVRVGPTQVVIKPVFRRIVSVGHIAVDSPQRYAHHDDETKAVTATAMRHNATDERGPCHENTSTGTGTGTGSSLYETLKFIDAQLSRTQKEGRDGVDTDTECLTNELKAWSSLPLSVQAGLTQYVYQMLGSNGATTDNRQSDDEDLESSIRTLNMSTLSLSYITACGRGR